MRDLANQGCPTKTTFWVGLWEVGEKGCKEGRGIGLGASPPPPGSQIVVTDPLVRSENVLPRDL